MADLTKYVKIKPCIIGEGDCDANSDGFTVWFVVGVQQFCVTPLACETRDEAEWMRDRLIQAIDKLITEQATTPETGAQQ